MTVGPRECSIADTLEVLGPRWTFLVVRELLFRNGRFDGIARATGAPRNLVAERLKRLQEAGLVDRRPYQHRPVRYEYELTARGRRLAEVLLLLMRAGDEARHDEPPVRWHHGPPHARHELDVELVCRHCGGVAADGLGDPTGRGAPAAPEPA